MSTKIEVADQPCRKCKKPLVHDVDKMYVHPAVRIGVLCWDCYVKIEEEDLGKTRVTMFAVREEDYFPCPWCGHRCFGACQRNAEVEDREIATRH